MRRIGFGGCSLRLTVGPSRRISPARLFLAIADIRVKCGEGQLTAHSLERTSVHQRSVLTLVIGATAFSVKPVVRLGGI